MIMFTLPEMARTVKIVRESIAPRFRCRECNAVFVKGAFDLPEADGSYCCVACERAAANEFRDMNALYGDVR